MPERPRGQEISFKPRAILRVNGRVMEAVDISPEYLRDFVDLHESIVAERIERFYRSSKQQANHPEAVIRPAILIARLALVDRENEALSEHGLNHPSRIHTHFSNLADEFIPYWSRLSETSFIPQVHVRGIKASEDTGGVWIGVTDRGQ